MFEKEFCVDKLECQNVNMFYKMMKCEKNSIFLAFWREGWGILRWSFQIWFEKKFLKLYRFFKLAWRSGLVVSSLQAESWVVRSRSAGVHSTKLFCNISYFLKFFVTFQGQNVVAPSADKLVQAVDTPTVPTVPAETGCRQTTNLKLLQSVFPNCRRHLSHTACQVPISWISVSAEKNSDKKFDPWQVAKMSSRRKFMWLTSGQ
jgi:hypothetical protein